MSNRKRINLSISESQFLEIEDMAKRGGFKGSCTFLVTLIDAFTQYAKKLEEWETLPDNSNLTIKTNINQRK